MANTDTQLLSNLAFALKRVYHPLMTRLIFEENLLLRELDKRAARMGMEGETMIIPVQTSSVESFRATTEDGSLARPTIVDGFDAEVPKRVHTSTVQFSHLTDLYTRAQRAAYINGKTKLMEETARGFKRNMNELFYQYGTGALARVNGAPNVVAGTFIVDDELLAASGVTFGTKYLRKHKRLQASANKTGTTLERATDIQLTLVVPSTLTCTAKGPMPDLADGDYLYPEGSKGRVTDGLMGIIDDGTVQNVYLTVNRTTTPEWQSQVIASVAGGNIENNISRLANRIRSSPAGGMDGELGGKSGWIAVTTPGVVQAWWEQLTPDRRYQVELKTKEAKPVFPAGYDSIMMWTPVSGAIQTFTNVTCPVGHYFLMFFKKNIWYIAQARDMGWYDDGGGPLTRVRGTFLQEASWYWPSELVCTRPDLQGKLTDITEST